ncbi:phosphotransferase family protein [Corynebacterium renale]|uniref:phosphotransferase family protein n=1 Tax=Corynebacterium renale TaxID=1724 RepID=UPI001F49046B|nr:phosphotransferase [Corynebacterium renale]
MTGSEAAPDSSQAEAQADSGGVTRLGGSSAPTYEDIIVTAEELLSTRFGGAQQLSDVERLTGSGTSVVLRCRVVTNPFLQERSVVVKYIPLTDDELDDAALVREIVAYQFTTSLHEDVRPGPVLLAHDIAQRIIVLTDSGRGDTFAELLDKGNSDQRIHILRNLGEALGLMHVGTAPKEQGFEILRARMAKKHPSAAKVNHLRLKTKEFTIQRGFELLRDADIEVPDTVILLAEASSSLMHTGHRAFTPYDLSPDNIIVAERTHFLDYEWAGFRNVVFDLASVVAGFPQYLFEYPITSDEADLFLEAWQREAATVWPDVQDDEALHISIATAVLGLAISGLTMMHYGSSHNIVAAVAALGDYETVITPDSSEVTPIRRLLAPAGSVEFSREELLMRRDLYETTEALARFAVRGRDTRLPVVADFARRFSELLDDHLER